MRRSIWYSYFGPAVCCHNQSLPARAFEPTAEKLLSAVLARSPRHAKANVAYGDILVRKGQLAEAQGHYETALQEDPESGPAHYKLSTLFFRLQRNEQAEKERILGARLNAEALKSSKIVFQLASPDGAVLNAVR